MPTLKAFVLFGILMSSQIGTAQIVNESSEPGKTAQFPSGSGQSFVISKDQPFCVRTKRASKIIAGFESSVVKKDGSVPLFKFIQIYPETSKEVSDESLPEIQFFKLLTEIKSQILQEEKAIPLLYGDLQSGNNVLIMSIIDADLDKENITVQIPNSSEDFECPPERKSEE